MAYIYNITTHIEADVHGPWLQWMRDTHIPEMLGTGKFLKAKMSRVLVEGEEGGFSYSVQFTVADKAILQQYYHEDAARLASRAAKAFGDKAVSFATQMQVVHEQYGPARNETHFLFAYGTLREKGVQQAVFSRALDGMPDDLNGYRMARHKVYGAYPTVEAYRSGNALVNGMCYGLSTAELLLADRYEGDAYKRIQVTLASGKTAWTYIACETAQP